MKKFKVPRGIIRIYPLFYLGIVGVFIGTLLYGLSYDEYEHIVRNINHNLFPIILLVFIIPSIIILIIHFLLSNYKNGNYIKEMYSIISFPYGIFIFFTGTIYSPIIRPPISIFLILGDFNFLVHAIFFWMLGIFFLINKIKLIYYFSIVPLLIGSLDFIFSLLRIAQTDLYLFAYFFMTTIMVLISLWGLYPLYKKECTTSPLRA